MIQHRFRIFNTLLFVFLLTLSFGQTKLQNPSFEDTPSDAMIPHGWFMCSEGTTPDILPGFWGVNLRPSEGNTYAGLIVRPDGSYESIGQRLLPALNADECYNFSFDVAHSKKYAGYNQEIQIRIWLSEDKCEKDQLIHASEIISNRKWQRVSVQFKPDQKMKYILIEAYSPSVKRGNILIDNFTSIFTCDRA